MFYTFLSYLFDIFFIITIPIYVLFIATLIRYRHLPEFNSPFFFLLINVGICELLKGFTYLITFELAVTGLCPQLFVSIGSAIAGFANVCNIGLGIALTLAEFSVALNRFTALIFPIRHKTLWTMKFAKILAALQWLIPFIIICPLIYPTEYLVTLATDNRTIILQFESQQMAIIYSFMAFLVPAPFAFATAYIYVHLFIFALIKRKSIASDSQQKAALKMAIAGFLSSFGIFILMIVNITDELLWVLAAVNFDYNIYTFLFKTGNDFAVTVTPYAMMIFSSSVRRRMAQMFFCGSEKILPMLTSVAARPMTMIRVIPK